MACNTIGIILAAGQSTRMGSNNKLTTPWHGKPIMCHVVEAAAASELSEFVVVTGHQADLVAAVLNPEIKTIHNPHYRTGMASSLKTGIKYAQAMGSDAALILLGDMPLVGAEQINNILQAEGLQNGTSIVQASCRGKPGNPVLFPSDLFEDLLQISGDQGAREIVMKNRDRLVQVDIGEAAKRDFDTPEAFAE